MLPPGWTTTMWQGEIYYWNSITGQTSATPPEMGVKTTSAAKGQKQRAGSMKSLSPREMWQQANEEVQAGALDAALEQRVRHREETRLDESMPFEDEGERSGEEGDEEMGHGTGLVRLLSSSGLVLPCLVLPCLVCSTLLCLALRSSGVQLTQIFACVCMNVCVCVVMRADGRAARPATDSRPTIVGRHPLC